MAFLGIEDPWGAVRGGAYGGMTGLTVPFGAYLGGKGATGDQMAQSGRDNFYRDAQVPTPNFRDVASPYLQMAQAGAPTEQGLGLQRDIASGRSPWQNIMLQKQQVGQAGRLDQLNKQAVGAQAQARNQLAMRGGLTRAAQNQVALEGLRGRLFGQQDIGRQGQADRLNIMTKAEEQRQNAINALTGQELAYGKNRQAVAGNYANLLQEMNLNDLKKYDTEQKALGARSLANAYQRQAAAEEQGFFSKLFS